MLENWLGAVLKEPVLLNRLLDFLEVPLPKRAKILETYPNCTLSPSEMCVADLINSLRTDSRYKLKSIDEFNKKFFSLKKAIPPKFLRLLIKVVAPMCGVQGTASKSLDILFKLVRGDTYKEYFSAISELLSLDISYLRVLRLDLHIKGMFQGDSGESALILCKILYDNMKKSNNALLCILHDSKEAFKIFNVWNTQELPQISTIQKPSIDSWKQIPTDDPDLHITFRNTQDNLELSIDLTVKATLERLICLVRDVDEIPQWNLFVKRIHLIEDISADIKVYLLELRAESGELELCYKAQTVFEDKTRTKLIFESIEHIKAPLREEIRRIKLSKHEYIIDLIYTEQQEILEGEEGYNISRDSVQTATSYYNISSMFTYNIRLDITMDLSLAKLIPGEFIGESTYFRDSWVNFKQKVSLSEVQRAANKKESNSMMDALSRKLTIGTRNRQFSAGTLRRVRSFQRPTESARPFSSII